MPVAIVSRGDASRVSSEMRACIAFASAAAAARGAARISQSYCALVLLEQWPAAEVFIPAREIFVPVRQLAHELVQRLPPIAGSIGAQAALPSASQQLAVLIERYGFLDDGEALLNIFLFNPDDVLAEAIAHVD